MIKKNVLLVEDDIKLQVLIKEYLERFNFTCTAFDDPLEALCEFKIHTKQYSIIILDLSLPNMDGFDFFKRVKEIYNIPILISTARGDIGNKIYGFELGADDYLSKPYEPRELILRISLILKKENLQSSDIQRICNFEINKKTKQIFLDDHDCEFTKIEYEIFLYLINHSNKNITRNEIIQSVKLHNDTKDRTIDTHVRNIRKKIYDDSKNPKYIKSMWGIGYKFIC